MKEMVIALGRCGDAIKTLSDKFELASKKLNSVTMKIAAIKSP